MCRKIRCDVKSYKVLDFWCIETRPKERCFQSPANLTAVLTRLEFFIGRTSSGDLPPVFRPG